MGVRKPVTLQIDILDEKGRVVSSSINKFDSRIGARQAIFKQYGIYITTPQLRQQVVLEDERFKIVKLGTTEEAIIDEFEHL